MTPKRREPIEDLDELNESYRLLKAQSKLINKSLHSKKTSGGKYPIGSGYSTQVTRPVRDLLRWMVEVEDILEYLIEEQHNK